MAWDGENGRIATDLLPRLPADLNKLETLSRLGEEQLREALEGFDCKKVDRKMVAERVQAVLGEDAPARKGRKRDTIKAIDRQFDIFAERLTRARLDIAVEANEDQLRACFMAGIAKLQQTVEIP